MAFSGKVCIGNSRKKKNRQDERKAEERLHRGRSVCLTDSNLGFQRR
jgi:hypothetical protein